jgi:hypothetical protein
MRTHSVILWLSSVLLAASACGGQTDAPPSGEGTGTAGQTGTGGAVGQAGASADVGVADTDASASQPNDAGYYSCKPSSVYSSPCPLERPHEIVCDWGPTPGDPMPADCIPSGSSGFCCK